MASALPTMQQTVAAGTSTGGGSNNTSAHPSFRRQRASRACETCHARKVRCDAASLGVPCTNCTAFGIDCRIPTPKRKKNQPGSKAGEDDRGDNGNDESSSPNDTSSPSTIGLQRAIATAAIQDPGDNVVVPSIQQTRSGSYLQFMKPKFARAPIKEAGRVAYLGESSNLSLLVHDRNGNTDVVHYPLPETARGAKARVNELDDVEMEILNQRGAFLLPPRALCDELVEAFFKWVAPIMPVINKTRFMRQYRDPKNPPSLLLLQAILLAGSRVCTNPQLKDTNGSTTPAAVTFYKRAKALFDANYEDDRVTIVQSLLLMGWYWEGPEDVTKNVFYWIRVAIVVAQGSGMHRSVENSQLSRSDKRLWRRIWWTLFSRDRSVAVALGRPVAINPEDSDVEMITEEDFIEDDGDRPGEHAADPVHVQFFIHYVKLTEIMGLVLSQQYSVASKFRRTNAIDLTHSDMALADWLQHCPREVYWEKQKHHFWAALLHSHYYTTLCLLHRAHMPPAGSPSLDSNRYEEAAYPSRNIAYQAAAMITAIIENLQARDELRYTPAFIVYSLFSALIMHVYEMRSSNKSVISATEQRINVCMNALKDVSRVWLVAKMVHTLFDSILGNKLLEERLQKAAGKRHHKNRATGPLKPAEDPPKRKFDDMDMGFSNGPPAPQVSYERSRPQTPAPPPARELPQQHQMPMHNVSGSPQANRQSTDAFMGNASSRNTTRPTTPFNPSLSYPGTPPELYLVTRSSPGIPQDLWQNFQPDQLFPADSNVSIPQLSPEQQQQQQPLIDPQLSTQPGAPPPLQTQMQPAGMHQPSGPQSAPPQIQAQQLHSPMASMSMHSAVQEPQGWGHIDPMQGTEDTWSTSSQGKGPVAPGTLNVEDWFSFFGIHSEMNGLQGTF